MQTGKCNTKPLHRQKPNSIDRWRSDSFEWDFQGKPSLREEMPSELSLGG